MITKKKTTKRRYLWIIALIIGSFFVLKNSIFGNKVIYDLSDSKKEVSLMDNGLNFKILSEASTIESFMQEQGIKINESDLVYPDRDTPLYPNAKITIKRATNFKVFADGEELEGHTFENSLEEAVLGASIELDEFDIISEPRNSFVYNGLEVEITRVEKAEETVQKDIEFKTLAEEDGKLGWRDKKITQKGINGIEEIKYEVVYHDGEEIGRKIIENTVIKEPVDEIVIQGTHVKTGKTHKGLASWYSHTGTMAAANPWLPMGSYVKVTNRANGKSVIVRINDRGPFGEGRIIDLDKVAFAKLASIGQGVIDVKMEEITN